MNANEHAILILSTGGTIDKVYFDALSEFQIGEPMARQIVSVGRVHQTVRVEEIMRKDSLEMDDSDRASILEAVRAAPEKRIIITHGTDTMTLTALALAPVSDKVIVLTGALTPARCLESDAGFNLGMAFAAAQLAAPGSYICMTGGVFPAGQVVKDRALGAFLAR